MNRQLHFISFIVGYLRTFSASTCLVWWREASALTQGPVHPWGVWEERYHGCGVLLGCCIKTTSPGVHENEPANGGQSVFMYVVCRTIGKDLLFFGGSIVVIRVLAVLLVEGAPQSWCPHAMMAYMTNLVPDQSYFILQWIFHYILVPLCYPRVVFFFFLRTIKVISDHYQVVLPGS